MNTSQQVEQSVYEELVAKSNSSINLVYVYEMCNEAVDSHSPGYSSARRLEVTSTKLRIDSSCIGCSATELFDEIDDLLKTVVNDGNLTETFKKVSGIGVAFFSATSSMVTVSPSPTVSSNLCIII